MNEYIIQNLSNKIWKTRKSRINTSDRLVFTNKFFHFLVSYYTLFILSMSIWALSLKDDNHISIFTIIASLILFGITLGVRSQNYTERTINLKNCYIKLDELYTDLDILLYELNEIDNNSAKDRFEEIRNEYSKVLDRVENHNNYDYLKFQITNKQEGVGWKDYLRYYKFKIQYVLIIIVLFLAPLSPIIFI